jgi:membrane protease subunit (stomatin/prohibitin family)
MTNRSNAITAINAFKAGTFPTLTDAANAHGARIEIVNVLYNNESLLSDSAFASDAVQATRESTCRGCVKFTAPNMCSECGCPVVFFTSQAHNVCPIGLWT